MNDIPLLVDELSLSPVPKMVRLRPLSLKIYHQRFCGGVSMTDLSKFSTNQLVDMKVDALRLRLNYIVMANSCGVAAERIAKEIERRKTQGGSTP